MKQLILLFLCMYIFIGCAHRNTKDVVSVEIQPPPIKFSEPVLHVVEVELIEPILRETPIDVGEVPFSEIYYECGWVAHSEQEEIRQLLKEAKVVLRLVGVRKEWVPINGKPKEYYVLSIE